MSLLPKRLQNVIERDLGIKVELPQSVNRGYWSSIECAYRWIAEETGGHRIFASEDSMAICVRHGVVGPRPPGIAQSEWQIDVNL